MIGSIKHAARKAAGPAAVAGAGVAGVAGGLVLKNLRRRKRVLGVPLPRSIAKPRLPEFDMKSLDMKSLDMKSLAKTVGSASKQFGESSKRFSRDIERVGDQAEKIGKILG